MNWNAFWLGAGLAAVTGALQYASVLPSPWGAMASAALTMLAVFMHRPNGSTSPDAIAKAAKDSDK